LNGLQSLRPVPISPSVVQLSTPSSNFPRPAGHWLRRAVIACLCTLAATEGASQVLMRAQAVDAANSRQVKAEFVVSFLSFVDWPATRVGAPQGQLLVAILGDPDFAELVRKAATHRPVAGRSVIVQAVPTPEGARDAHLAFIGASEAERLPAILRSLGTQPVLTVGDTDGFAQEGVAINLYTFDKRIRIEVNTTAAARAGLRLSSNLLRLARIVQ
jgi:hypothetical protein